MKSRLIILTYVALFACCRERISEGAKEEGEVLGTGKISTIVDGYDVKRVNLYSSTAADRRINCSLVNADEVNIMAETTDYFLVEKIDEEDCKGYCMKKFVSVELILKN